MEKKTHIEERAKPWLQGLSRRTLNDIDPVRGQDVENIIYILITGDTWPYKTKTDFYYTRDKALMSLCFLTMGRIHEVLTLRKSQFDFNSIPGFLVIHNILIGKRSKKTVSQFGKTYIDLGISLDNRFLPFITEHLSQVDDKLFNFSRYRAWTIIKYVTGKWCHYFRSMSQRHYLYKLGNPATVSNIFKVDVRTILHYTTDTWEEHKEKFK